MAVDFVAIDVETANPDMATICQIGVASYRRGDLVDQWCSYIDPQDYFDLMNVFVHGIDENTVRDAPLLPGVVHPLYDRLDGQVVVSHTPFDRTSIRQAMDKYSLRHPTCTWLDSARVVRRTWEQFARKGYGLGSICDYLDYQFDHHHALEDAKAAGHIMLAAMECTGLDIGGWLKRVEQPIDLSNLGYQQKITRDGNVDGPLFGEVLVFTGALSLPRREAADMAASAGCEVVANVSRRTSVLVVGDQDIRRLVGHQKSTKHRKAEALAAKGHPIRILTESDFKALVALEESQ